jgi:hypothetical protein
MALEVMVDMPMLAFSSSNLHEISTKSHKKREERGKERKGEREKS